MNITETPIAMNSIATDLFEINELYARAPVNLADPIESDKMPKTNMICPILEGVSIL